MIRTKIFKKEHLNRTLAKRGFVVLDGLSQNQISVLNDVYYTDRPNCTVGGFQSTHFYKDIEYKRRVNRAIIGEFEGFIENHLVNYRPIFGNFMVKEAEGKGEMPLHADWTYVDESRYVSLGFWIPLIDTNERNGRIGVVPRSHLIQTPERGPQIKSPFQELNTYIAEKYGKFLNLKAGQVLIYNHKTLHFSMPNYSAVERVAINLVCVPNDAKLVHYARLKDNKSISYFEPSTTEFYLDYELFGIPKEPAVIEDIRYDDQQFDKQDVDKKFRLNPIVYWLNSIFSSYQ